MEKIILTGDRPTGRLHVGHYVGSLKRRVELQNSGEYDKIFIMIADAQALTDNADNPEKIRQNIIEVALDYLSCGLDPEKCTIFIQSQVPELRSLHLSEAHHEHRWMLLPLKLLYILIQNHIFFLLHPALSVLHARFPVRYRRLE